MADFINTIDLLGDDVVVDSIINRTITEFKDDTHMLIGDSAFSNCTELATVWLPNSDFAAYTSAGSQFKTCSSLVDVSIPSAKTLGPRMFNGCTALQKIVLPGISNRIYASAFDNCTNLHTVDTHKTFVFYGGNQFSGCSSLVALILRGDAVVTLGASNSFLNTPIASGNGYIYVPRALVDSYKAATNWSTYATKFRALEDYTVDGTITGELDETKI